MSLMLRSKMQVAERPRHIGGGDCCTCGDTVRRVKGDVIRLGGKLGCGLAAAPAAPPLLWSKGMPWGAATAARHRQ